MNTIGQRLKQHGLDAVEEHNEPWIVRMRKAAKAHSALFGSVSADDMRVCAPNLFNEPHHPNAMGALFRPREFRCIGRKPSETPSRHGAEIKIWRWMRWG